MNLTSYKKTILLCLSIASLIFFLSLRRYYKLSSKSCFALSVDSISSIADLPVHNNVKINDASCLNITPVYAIVQIKTLDDIKVALHFAKKNSLKISIAGVRHSMGGQAFCPHSLVLDMTSFNKMELQEENKLLVVQSGATWHDIQLFLHEYNLAVKAMQSTDLFTIGGSISVNAHGMDHKFGSLADTLQSIRLMLVDGTIITLSSEENSQLFDAVIGGYGLFGVIIDATIQVTENCMYERKRKLLKINEFSDFYASKIEHNQFIDLMYATISTGPLTFFNEMIIYMYIKDVLHDHAIPAIRGLEKMTLRRFLFNYAKSGTIGQGLKWLAQKYLDSDTFYETCADKEQQTGNCLVSRNEAMHDSVEYLKSDLKNQTDILQEYFIPKKNYRAFIQGAKKILREHRANLLNATIRIVHRQKHMMLNYAKEDAFAFVFYINQKINAYASRKMNALTNALIDLAIDLEGTFFLPYQLTYSKEQLIRAYPNIQAFFKVKKLYDPSELFTNYFYEKYK